MTDPLDGFALELRASAPAAPARLRARVDAIAAQAPPAPASRRAWFQPRRALLIAAPAAAAAMLTVAIGHGLTSTSTQSNALGPRTKEAEHADSLSSLYGVQRSQARTLGPLPLQGALNSNAPLDRSASGASAPAGTAQVPAAKAGPQTARTRAQDYRATLTVRVSDIDGMSDAMKAAITAT